MTKRNSAEYWFGEINAALQSRDKVSSKYEWKKIKDLWNEGGMQVDVYTTSDTQRIAPPSRSAFVNWVYSYISTFIPAVYWRHPKVFVCPKRSMYLTQAKIAEAKINYALDISNFRRMAGKVALDALIFGIGWMKVGWFTKFGQVPPSSAATGFDGKTSSLDRESYFYTDEPYAYRVSPERILIDPEAQIYEEARWMAQEHYRLAEDVENDPYLKYTDSVAKFNMRDTTKDPLSATVAKDEQKWVRMWEIWDRENNRVNFLCDGSEKFNRVIDPWPYAINGFPYEPLIMSDSVDTFYPPSVVLPWLPLVEELAFIRTMRLDHLSRMVSKYVVKTGSMNNEQQTSFLDQDNELVEVDDPDGIREFSGLKPDAHLYEAEERVKQDIREISGFSELLSGSIPYSRVSATSASIMQKNSSLRFNFASEKVAEFIKACAQKLLKIITDFQQYPDVIRISSDPSSPPIEYTKENIDGEFMFSINVEDMSFTSREQKIKNEYDALTALAPFPQVKPHPMLRDVLSAFGKEPIEEYLNPEQGPPVDPGFENEMMLKGVPIQPNPQEDFQTHLAVHSQFMQTPVYTNAIRAIPQIAAMFNEHVQMTLGMFGQSQQGQGNRPQPGISPQLQAGNAGVASMPVGGPRNMRGPQGNPLMQALGGEIQ